MANQIQVGSAPADPGFSVRGDIKDVSVKGERSNQVTVNRPDGQSPAGSSPVPSGPVEVRKGFNGETTATVGGLQMSAAEARSLGIISEFATIDVDEDGFRVVDRKAVPKADAGETDGDTGSEAPGAPDDYDVAGHATELNAMGDAFAAAGLGEEEGLSRAVAGAVINGELPDDVSDALIDRFGEEDAQLLVENAMHYIATTVENTAAAAGLNIKDPDVVAGLDAAFVGKSAAFFDAVRGRPAALNDAIFAYAKSRKAR